jgi:hypothetical protein
MRQTAGLAAATAAAATLAFVAPASAGVVVGGGAWLGGHGVDVCYPSDGGCAGNQAVGGVPRAPWQCVELAQRLYTRMGWHDGYFSGVSYAYEVFSWARANGMAAHRNGSGYVPVPGDMIVSGPSAAVRAGHVAIVDRVDLAAGTIHAVEENADPSGRSTYRVDGTRLSRPGPYGNIVGVVHSPLDRFRNHGWDGRFHDGLLYRDGAHGRVYLIAGGARFRISGRHERVRLGYARAHVEVVAPGALRRVAATPHGGTLLRAPGVPGLWLIHRGRRFRVVRRGHRRLFVVPRASLERIPRGARW